MPIILGVIDNAKKGSVIDSAYGYKDAVQKFYVERLYDDTSFKLDGTYVVEDGMLGGIEIPISGTKPTDGTLIYENNVLVDGCLIFDDKMVSVDENGMMETNECALIDDYVIDGKMLVKRKYKTGDAIPNYGGYNWHVVGDDGYNVTLLMDYSTNGSSDLPMDDDNIMIKVDTGSILIHCSSDKNNCQKDSHGHVMPSWKTSIIQQYLNSTFYDDILPKIENRIVPLNICNDSSLVDSDDYSYGGYLQTEINSLNSYYNSGVASCNSYGVYNIRLLTLSEYYNMTPNLNYSKSLPLKENLISGYNSGYIAKVSSIEKIDNTSDYSWLYQCNATINTPWYVMNFTSNSSHGEGYETSNIIINSCGGNFDKANGIGFLVIRPVITVSKFNVFES